MDKDKFFLTDSAEAYNLRMYGTPETPLMEFRENGEIWIRGEKALTNKEVSDGILHIFNGGKLPTSHLNVRTLKPLHYYEDHAPGETLHVKLQDATQLIQDGYVEIVVNGQGSNE